jgi:hypothetical protein
MADAAPVVHIGENSPEEVVFKMMTLIASVENRQNYGHGPNPMTREWVLKTYWQCGRIVKGHNPDETLAIFNPGPSPSAR